MLPLYFGLLFILLLFLTPPCLGTLHLTRQSANMGRYSTQYEPPEIRMRSGSSHWLQITCTVARGAGGFHAFIDCPALESPCYDDCLPTQPCSSTRDSKLACLPDRISVNCSQIVRSDGGKVTNLWIDKRDRRLHGSWFCRTLGMKSSVVDVVPDMEEAESLLQPMKPSILEPIEVPGRVKAENTQLNELSDSGSQLIEEEQPPYHALASFLSRSPWIFCLIAIFIISVTLNIILWCRWCLVCIFTARRRKYNEDQKTLGDMICLPTKINRTQSALWDNDVYPGPIFDGLQNPSCPDENLSNFQRLGTFGPTNFYFDPTQQQQQQNQSSFSDVAFPQYFNTMPPDQLWRTRNSPAAFTPGANSVSSGRSGRIRGGIDSFTPFPVAPANRTDNIQSLSPSSHPPQAPFTPQKSKELKRFPRVTMTPINTMAPVYDDVASSSTITVISRNELKPKSQLTTQSPSLTILNQAKTPPDCSPVYTSQSNNWCGNQVGV